jgi:hypothetical protein
MKKIHGKKVEKDKKTTPNGNIQEHGSVIIITIVNIYD